MSDYFMVKQKSNNEPVKNKADHLLVEFIAELDGMSSNGVVKHLYPARISDLREYYIGQCPSGLQNSLAEQIDLVLSSKLHYFDREKSMMITELTESKIMEKIRSIVRSLKDNAPKFIGFALSIRWFNPVLMTRAFIQPAIANSLLTLAVVMNPPGVETIPVQEIQSLNETALLSKTEVDHNGKLYADLMNVRPYAEPAAAAQPETLKKTASGKLNAKTARGIELSGTKHDHTLTNIGPLSGNLSKMLSDTAEKETPKKTVHSDEIRPLSEIQRAFYLNDNRLKNCLQVNSRELSGRKGKVSLRFDIAPSGQPKNIQVIDSVLTQNVADRLALQIYQMRFSPVDKKLGDQSVRHTLFF